jgi:hypothetical protein
VAMCDGEVDIINTVGDKLINPYWTLSLRYL